MANKKTPSTVEKKRIPCCPDEKLHSIESAWCFDPLIDIQVGQDDVRGNTAKHYKIHKGLLCHFSGYFAGAFRSDVWEEAKNQTFRLLDDEPEVFDAVYRWLYTRQFCDSTWDWHKHLMSLLDICKVYVFADKRLMPAIKNAAIDAFIDAKIRPQTRNEPFVDELISYVYENTSKNSGLRNLLLAMSIAWIELKDLAKSEFSVPKSFLIDIISTLDHRAFPVEASVLSGRGDLEAMTKQWRNISPCAFHDHPRSNISYYVRDDSKGNFLSNLNCGGSPGW